MTNQVLNYTIAKSKAVQTIMKIRHEWEEAARGDSLLEIKGSVGYLLADIAVGLGLTGNDLSLALGDLADELSDFIEQSSR